MELIRAPALPSVLRVRLCIISLGFVLFSGITARGIRAGDFDVTSPPQALREELSLAPFYIKWIDVDGFAIVGSEQVSDDAVREAAWIVRRMLAGRDDIRQAMVANKTRLAVMSSAERTTDIPEHSDLTPARYWDKRARGLGATIERPAVSCGEENLLEFEGDPYVGENILIHEFAHGMHQMGMNYIDPQFDARLAECYQAALDAGLWKETYAATNKEEYWAEGVQIWFHCNRTNCREHNHLNTRDGLREYDAGLARLLTEVFRGNDWLYVPPSQRDEPAHLAGFDRTQAPRFAWSPELLEWHRKYEEEKKSKGEK